MRLVSVVINHHDLRYLCIWVRKRFLLAQTIKHFQARGTCDFTSLAVACVLDLLKLGAADRHRLSADAAQCLI